MNPDMNIVVDTKSTTKDPLVILEKELFPDDLLLDLKSKPSTAKSHLQNIRKFNSDFFPKDILPLEESFEGFFIKAVEMNPNAHFSFCPNFDLSFFIKGYQRVFGKDSIQISLDLLSIPYPSHKRLTPVLNTSTATGYIFSCNQSINPSTSAENAYTLFNKETYLNLKEYLLLQAFTGNVFDKNTVTYLQDKDRYGFMLIAYYIADRKLLHITTEFRHIENLVTKGSSIYKPLPDSGTRPIQIFK